MIEPLATLDTGYAADSVEWCPDADSTDLLVCGTYQLEEGDTATACQRTGRIHLCRYDIEERQNRKIDLLHSIDTPAILDQKWLEPDGEGRPVLAVATGNGRIMRFHVADDRLQLIAEIDMQPDDGTTVDESNIALSLDTFAGRIVSSDSRGRLTIVDCNRWTIESNWAAHEYEAWTCAFDRTQPQVVYSGGDDSLFKVHDLRTGGVVLARHHTAGVTAISAIPNRANRLLTGSYDDTLQLIDLRALGRQSLYDVNLGGGVWRIKCDPFDGTRILCACMYWSFSVVMLLDDDKLELHPEFRDVHSSIRYGADWCRRNGGLYRLHAALCSFYDRKMSVCGYYE